MASVNNTNSASSVAYSYLQYKNKIGGLVSGMDIDSIMEKLMKAESAQMEKLQQQKQKYEWKRDTYREVNTKLNTFQQDLFDKFGLQSKWSSKTATVTNNTGAVSVEAKSNATGNLSIQSVTAATASTSSNLGYKQATGLAASKITNDSTLASAGISETIKIFDETVSTFGEVVDKLNAKGYSASLTNGQLKVTANSSAEKLDEDTVKGLTTLGFTFSKSTDKLTYKDENDIEKTANGATKLSDVGLNTGEINFNINTTSVKVELGNLVSQNNDATISDLLTEIKDKTGLTASFSGGAITFSSNNNEAFNVNFNNDSNNDFGIKDKIINSTSETFVAETLSTTKLSDVGLNTGVLSFSVNGVATTIDLADFSANENIADLLTKINNKTGLNASFSNGAINIESDYTNKFSMNSTNNNISSTNGEVYALTASMDSSIISGKNTIEEVLGKGTSDGSFVLRAVQADGTTKDKEITYKATDTIDSLMSKINSSGVGVTALFSNGQLSFSASNTGQRTDGGAEVSLVGPYQSEDSDGVPIDSTKAVELFSKLSGGSEEYSEVREEYALATGGKNASMTVNGVEYTQASNVFTISGYTITANEDFSSSKSINISSTNNTSEAVDKVKEFVEMYNSLIEDFNKQTSEKRNVDYDPLTDAQKAEMTTSEIEKWEEKAKAGLLKGDTSINNMLSKMRSILNGGTGGDTLYNIGVTTSSTWSDNGKLVIDETKLTAAIEKDPDILSRIFVGTTEDPGMATQLRTEAKTAISNIEKSAGKESSAENQYSLGKTITSLTTKIDDWKDRLKDIEERYWNQFSAMETAIQKANNQSSVFSS